MDIKNKETLEGSLDLYVSGELLAGDNKYHCSECGKKVEAVRRTALQVGREGGREGGRGGGAGILLICTV